MCAMKNTRSAQKTHEHILYAATRCWRASFRLVSVFEELLLCLDIDSPLLSRYDVLVNEAANSIFPFLPAYTAIPIPASKPHRRSIRTATHLRGRSGLVVKEDPVRCLEGGLKLNETPRFLLYTSNLL